MSAFDERRGMSKPAPVQWWDKIAPPAGFSADPRPKGWVDPATASTAQWQKPLTPEQQALADAFARAIMNSIQTVEMAPHQAMPFRGSRWEVDTGAGVIINTTNKTSNQLTSANAVSTATGATWNTDNTVASANLSIVSYRIPDNSYGIIRDLAIRNDSEIGWADVKFTLLIGGKQFRAISARANFFYRDAPLELNELILPGQLVDLQATNTSAVTPHFIEAVMRGWIFPPTMLGDSLKALVQNNSSRS